MIPSVNEGETPWIKDDAMAAELWRVSEALTGNYLPAQGAG